MDTAETVPLVAVTPSDTAATVVKTPGSGPVPPTFTNQDYQVPTIRELRATKIGVVSSPGKLNLIIYCPLNGRCPNCNSTVNSVGKKKLSYAVPWPKTIVGIDMGCVKCSKHFMTHDPKYVETLPFGDQMKCDFVTGKGNGCHISILRLLRYGLNVSQLERYVEEEIRQHYLRLKDEFCQLWDKVCFIF